MDYTSTLSRVEKYPKKTILSVITIPSIIWRDNKSANNVRFKAIFILRQNQVKLSQDSKVINFLFLIKISLSI